MITLYMLYAFLAGALMWPLYRLFNPWKCKCGKVHWSTTKFFEHLTMKHTYDEGKRT